MKNNTHASPLETALGYIERGWQPLPVSLQTKKPIGVAWQNRAKLTAKRAAGSGLFNGGEVVNVGVQMGPKSDGLTDIDLDCREAIIAAPLLLPKTGAMFGRKSKPQSHRLYTTGLAGSIDKAAMQFRDIEGTMLLELRIGGGGKGAQSVFPGSTHESGEAIEWSDAGDPTTVDDAELLQQVKRLAAAVLLARYWPLEGQRHDAALTVSEIKGKLRLRSPHHSCGESEVRKRGCGTMIRTSESGH